MWAMISETIQKSSSRLSYFLAESYCYSVTIIKMILLVDPDVLLLNEKYLRNQKMIVVSLITSFTR